MKLPKVRKVVYKKDPQQDAIQRFIVIWEKRIRPDAVDLLNAIADDTLRLSTTGFFNALEARVMAQIVMDVVGPPPTVDKKAPVVQKIS